MHRKIAYTGRRSDRQRSAGRAQSARAKLPLDAETELRTLLAAEPDDEPAEYDQKEKRGH